jgi:hypothetical protein
MVSINKLLSGENILIGLVVVVLVGGIYLYTNQKTHFKDSMTGGYEPSSSQSSNYSTQKKAVGITADGEPSLRNSAAQNVPQQVGLGSGLSGGSSLSGAKSKDVANPSDLLPQTGGNSWAKLNPNANVNQVVIPDLLEAGYHIGLDTIGQTMKNPNLQERSEPIIPKQAVSPWNNSSYEPDIARVPLEIGYGCN